MTDYETCPDCGVRIVDDPTQQNHFPHRKPPALLVEEWRVAGYPGHGYPPYEFIWRSDDPRWGGEAEAHAREFINKTAWRIERYAWDDGPYLDHRTVVYTAWEAADPSEETP